MQRQSKTKIKKKKKKKKGFFKGTARGVVSVMRSVIGGLVSSRFKLLVVTFYRSHHQTGDKSEDG